MLRFHASRLTVARALKELQLEGLAIRRAGSGTYARRPERAKGHVFGLLIPDLGRTEIFEPVCQGMMDARRAAGHSLLWGDTFSERASPEEQAWRLCRNYIDQKVAGVFFAPLEWLDNKDDLNQRIAGELEAAGIPVVLLDRCIAAYPGRSHFDLVGIDNRRAGYVVTEHLLQHGCRRIAFIARPLSAPTVEARIVGYREALWAAGADADPGLLQRIDGSDPNVLQDFIRRQRPDGFVCANDNTATLAMRSLQALGIEVPRGMRVIGIDDVKYASLLPLPLTTLRQPCREIGAAAVSAMLDRLRSRRCRAREILLDFTLILRQSCGPHDRDTLSGSVRSVD